MGLLKGYHSTSDGTTNKRIGLARKSSPRTSSVILDSFIRGLYGGYDSRRLDEAVVAIHLRITAGFELCRSIIGAEKR